MDRRTRVLLRQWLERRWNPGLHPRGPDGRFTKSFARPANSKQRKRINYVRNGPKPKRVRTPAESTQLLSQVAPPPERRGPFDVALAQLRAANQSLRAGRTPPDNAIADSMRPLTEPVQAFRAVPRSEFGSVSPEDLRGFVVRDAGFFPASTAPTAPQPGEVRMEINVPAGTRVAASPDTHELVIDAGTEMSVDDIRANPDGSTVMTLTALPPEGAETPDAPDGSADPDTETPASTPAASGSSPAGTATGGTATGDVGALIDGGLPTILDNDEASNATRRRARDLGAAAINGEYGGLNVEVTSAGRHFGGPEGENQGVNFRIRITDADGNEVGEAERAIYRDDEGNLVARHELLELEPEVRGRGFAAAFNAHLMEWYRAQGVTRIELTANIDVGGYAWASHGYDFADEGSASGIAERLRERIDSAPPEVQEAARDVLDRFSQPFGSDGYPTPFEISRLGRGGGATNWLGRDVLLGSHWEGTRWL